MEGRDGGRGGDSLEDMLRLLVTQINSNPEYITRLEPTGERLWTEEEAAAMDAAAAAATAAPATASSGVTEDRVPASATDASDDAPASLLRLLGEVESALDASDGASSE